MEDINLQSDNAVNKYVVTYKLISLTNLLYFQPLKQSANDESVYFLRQSTYNYLVLYLYILNMLVSNNRQIIWKLAKIG